MSVKDKEKMAADTTSDVKLLNQTMGDAELVSRIKSSKILLVGAGGIGCEVLKGLLLSGFESITIIDLDTIDVSNLNRQFLYNQSHVGLSKAKVSAEVAVKLFSHRDPASGEPISKVEPIHDSILNTTRFTSEFFKQFTFVINALDNNTTRIHVNRACISANVPLIESGSGGYLGNVKLIMKGITQCFECIPPAKEEKNYASCTIRTTPTEPIHCIVWAKHLFNQLFGAEFDEDISPDINPDDLVQNDGTTVFQETPQLTKQTTREFVESIDYEPKLLFDKLFATDIHYLLTMKHLWENRRKEPRVVTFDLVEQGQMEFDAINNNSSEKAKNCIERDQQHWSMQQCLDMFVASTAQLSLRYRNEGGLVWDKDDDVAVDFVTAVSNFRSHCFFIGRKSRYDVKQLAGNIKPAIASTNTIVGGFIILQTMKLLSSLAPHRFIKQSNAKSTAEEQEEEAARIRKNNFVVYVSNMAVTKLKRVAQEILPPPIPTCYTCSGNIQEILVALPLSTTTLGAFLQSLLLNRFKCISPDVTVPDSNKILWFADAEEDEEEEEVARLKAKTLASFAFMNDGVKLMVADQDFKLHITLRDETFDPEENDGDFFKILTDYDLESLKNGKQEEAEMPEKTKKTENGTVTVEDDFEWMVESVQSDSKSLHSKRSIENTEDDGELRKEQNDANTPNKRVRVL